MGVDLRDAARAARDFHDTRPRDTDILAALMSIIERLEATLAQGNENVQLRFGLASAYFREKRFEDARQHAAVAVELDPDYSAAWRLLGRSLLELDEKAEAKTAFEKGIEAAEQRGDMQLVKEMSVFLKRLQREEQG
jgi:tetratricopeptide (TPR) repeat protein